MSRFLFGPNATGAFCLWASARRTSEGPPGTLVPKLAMGYPMAALATGEMETDIGQAGGDGFRIGLNFSIKDE